MNEYELTVLIHPDLEMNLDLALDKIKKVIESADGKIIKEDNWGKKKLAYQIKKQDFAVYYAFYLELPAQAPAKISSTFNITDEVLRYLLVKKDEKLEKAKAVEAARESKEETNKEEE